MCFQALQDGPSWISCLKTGQLFVPCCQPENKKVVSFRAKCLMASMLSLPVRKATCFLFVRKLFDFARLGMCVQRLLVWIPVITQNLFIQTTKWSHSSKTSASCSSSEQALDIFAAYKIHSARYGFSLFFASQYSPHAANNLVLAPGEIWQTTRATLRRCRTRKTAQPL